MNKLINLRGESMRPISTILRTVYPFQSGMGVIANSSILKRLDGNRSGEVTATSGRFKMVVPQDDFVGRSIKYFGDLDKKKFLGC